MCFRDDEYVCICTPNYYRAECFGYDFSDGKCDYCLADGLCLIDHLSDTADEVCLCTRCHYGKFCQFSNEFLSFTLDSLVVDDILRSPKLASASYITIVGLVFLIGLFNNFCGFLTFLRPQPRLIGAGNYLLIVSILNQCTLSSLLLKVIHIVLYGNGVLFDLTSLNLFLCKTIPFLLSAFTRANYWLTSLVTMERLSMVLFLALMTARKPKFALSLSLLIVTLVTGMHIHEVLYYNTVTNPAYASAKITICVTNYGQSITSTYNRVNVLFHHFVPFFVQALSITILILQITRSRARTTEASHENTFLKILKRKFKMNKEHYFTPTVIILSSLPQIVFSFTYACSELKEAWQKYTLMATYLLSYLPQILGFVLYVLPSTKYKEEFQNTFIGKRILKK